MEQPEVIIEYCNNKNSSGRIINGVIYLRISNRLEPLEKERHIKKLKKRLLNKIKWAKNYYINNDGDGIIKTDEELGRLADTINKAYYNFPLKKVGFHRQNSTWGTCSLKTRQIYISYRLIGASLELLWYVLTHEICHLSEPSHNRNFWNLVSKACPNFTECQKKLKAYGLQQKTGS